MNRIDRLFQTRNSGILSVYLTAGYPELNDTHKVIRELAQNGVDMIEIGMPFSDPLADGPLLQVCNHQALENGMTLNRLFEQLGSIREKVNIPLLLMGYLNPVLNYGIEKFCRKARDIGMDGVILPDLPVREYTMHYQKHFKENGLHMIFLISPQTSQERIREIDTLGSGFIYMVSSASTTGVKSGFQPEQAKYFERIKTMDLELPQLIGFGISTRETYEQACQYASGAIIGSAFMKSLMGEGT
ncbi:MAG: tryptophan synthase subunit alpha, partial [Bacteroidales bacterium]|nr:tryptophan synthase subunit alpha [Bacteroidales bacterium]